jgi:hypothetical protein
VSGAFRRGAALVPCALVAAALLLAPGRAEAQGEAFTRRRTESFTFVYRARYERRVRDTIATAEESRRVVVERLGADGDALPVVEVRFARNVPEMQSLCPRPPPAWADAVAFWPDQVIVISLTSSGHRPVAVDTVFRHELAHLALRWVVGDAVVPRWFNEGLAVLLSDEAPLERLELLWPAAARGRLTPLRHLDRRFPAREREVNQAYAESADAVRFFTRHRGEWRVRELLARVGRGQPFYDAMADTWGEPVASLERAWHRDVRQRNSVVPAVTAGMTLWVAAGAMAVFAYIKRRRDIRRRIAAMPGDDEDDTAARDGVGDTGSAEA